MFSHLNFVKVEYSPFLIFVVNRESLLFRVGIKSGSKPKSNVIHIKVDILFAEFWAVLRNRVLSSRGCPHRNSLGARGGAIELDWYLTLHLRGWLCRGRLATRERRARDRF